MQRTRAIVAALALLVLVLGVSTAAAVDEPDSRRVAESEPVEEFVGPIPPLDDAGATAVAVGTYIATVAYDEAVARSAEFDAWLGTLYTPPPRSAPTTSASYSGGGGTTVGECTGFAIPDYIIQKESGGDPSAYNPSGAYGCAQTLLSHYSGGSCSGFDPYTIEGQRACVDKLSNGGTNLDPWAETR